VFDITAANVDPKPFITLAAVGGDSIPNPQPAQDQSPGLVPGGVEGIQWLTEGSVRPPGPSNTS
jgi:hypothetical protein